MEKTPFYPLALLTALLLTACSTNDNPIGPDDGAHDPATALDPGPAYSEKRVSVTRDGKSDGEVTLRFYSDQPSVAYIAVSNFHKLISGSGTMSVERQGSQYLLTTRSGSATVNVVSDQLNTPSLTGLVSLRFITDPTLPAGVSYDGNKYLKVDGLTPIASFAAPTTTLDFARYSIDLHDDGSQVYIPFATLADLYSDDLFHGACYNGKRVSVNTRVQDTNAYNICDPEFAAEPYKQNEVAVDMAKYRYNELCFLFDYIYGYPGRTLLEKSGMKQYGLDATLDKIEHGKAVKQLLQSPLKTDFLWGMNGLQVLINDGGHTTVLANAAIPKAIQSEQINALTAAQANHPEVDRMFSQYVSNGMKQQDAYDKLLEQRKQAYGDRLYCISSNKQTAVIIIDSFNDMDTTAWNQYYASAKSDADWRELLTHYKTDNFITLLYGLEQAKADGAKNVILDLSHNGGGSTDLVIGFIGVLGKSNKASMWSQNVLEGMSYRNDFLVDRNFDGRFDDLDLTSPKIDCSGMRIGVLTSQRSFSCGNLFPSLMQDLGFPILGEQSGGGSCSIQCMTTADGFQFVISAYASRLTNAKGEDIDPGIAPNIPFGYEHFYDIDYLGRRLSEWK